MVKLVGSGCAREFPNRLVEALVSRRENPVREKGLSADGVDAVWSAPVVGHREEKVHSIGFDRIVEKTIWLNGADTP